MSGLSGRAKRTDRARATFLESLADTCNVSESARRAGIGRRTVYEWKAADPVFSQLWDDAEEVAADKLEMVAWTRATSGASDRMLEILLKGHRPRYRDKQQVILTGKDDGPIDYREVAAKEVAELFGMPVCPGLEVEVKS